MSASMVRDGVVIDGVYGIPSGIAAEFALRIARRDGLQKIRVFRGDVNSAGRFIENPVGGYMLATGGTATREAEKLELPVQKNCRCSEAPYDRLPSGWNLCRRCGGCWGC